MSGTNGLRDFFELRGFGRSEDGRFLRFLEIVENAAWERGLVFFI